MYLVRSCCKQTHGEPTKRVLLNFDLILQVVTMLACVRSEEVYRSHYV